MSSYNEPKFEMRRSRPRRNKTWEHNARLQSTTAEIYTEHGIVNISTYPADPEFNDAPHTTVSMWLHPFVYCCSFNRHYKDRYLCRLARRFAWRCYKLDPEAAK